MAANGVMVDAAAAVHPQTRAQVCWDLHQLCPWASVIPIYQVGQKTKDRYQIILHQQHQLLNLVVTSHHINH